jgi:tetratricopeptide (TPR) repeat protein
MSRVIKENSRDAVALALRAQFESQLGNYPAAINDYTAALKEKPGELLWIYNRGWAHFNSGRFRDSSADAGKILELQPNVAEAYFLRSASKLRLNDLAGGKTDFDTAVQLKLDDRLAAQLRPVYYPPTGATGTR